MTEGETERERAVLFSVFLCVSEQSGTQQHNKGPLTYRVFCALKFVISNVRRAVCALIMEGDAVAVRPRSFFPGASAPHRDKNISTFQNAASAPRVMWRNVLLVTGERSWWLLSNDKCLRSATARTLWKKEKAARPSVFPRVFRRDMWTGLLNLYVCRGGALWLAYHRTQTQSATQWECLFNPSTDIDSYYSYDTRTRQSALSVPDTRFSRVTGSL